MSTLTLTMLERQSSPLPSPSEVSAGFGSRRYQYVRLGLLSAARVIVDIGANGEEDWTEQEPGESRWYSFVPSVAERELVRSWLMAGQSPTQTVAVVAS